MTGRSTVQHQFVDIVPDTLQEGVVYVCIPYTTAVHLCLCGCSEEVVTPIRPTGWRLTFDGIAISLHPSIGNWDFTCQSHYWISHNRVHWDRQWTPAKIEATRRREDAHRARHFAVAAPTPPPPTSDAHVSARRRRPTLRVPKLLRPRSWLRHESRRHHQPGTD